MLLENINSVCSWQERKADIKSGTVHQGGLYAQGANGDGERGKSGLTQRVAIGCTAGDMQSPFALPIHLAVLANSQQAASSELPDNG